MPARRTDPYLVAALGAAFVFVAVIFVREALPATAGDNDTYYDNILDTMALLTAICGLAAGLVSYRQNAQLLREQSRKQHTITILLETRLSEEFRLHNERRKATFREDYDIDFATWRQAMTGTDTSARDGAQALTFLLNYYEFIALGISMGDLDEDMLRRSIRGIMCNLVDDARFVIAGIRGFSPLAYENLCALYARWRRDGAVDIHGNPTERPIP